MPEVVPIRRPQVFVPRDELLGMFAPARLDPTLLDELREMRTDVAAHSTARVERLFGA